MSEQPDYTAYWAAAIARHRALIAAGRLSPVGVKRVVGEREEEEEAGDDE